MGNHFLFILVTPVLTFVFLLILVRWIGETQISQATYFNWVAGACMGNVAANMLTASSWNDVASNGIILVIFSGVTILASLAALKSRRFRSITSGVPILLIHQGEFIFPHLKKGKINQDLLKQMLREQGYFDYRYVECAILEPTGSLSVLPMPSSDKSVTPEEGNPTDRQNPVSQERQQNQHIK